MSGKGGFYNFLKVSHKLNKGDKRGKKSVKKVGVDSCFLKNLKVQQLDKNDIGT